MCVFLIAWTDNNANVLVVSDTTNVAALLGHKLTNVDEMHSQREDLSKATLEETKSYVSKYFDLEIM